MCLNLIQTELRLQKSLDSLVLSTLVGLDLSIKNVMYIMSFNRTNSELKYFYNILYTIYSNNIFWVPYWFRRGYKGDHGSNAPQKIFCGEIYTTLFLLIYYFWMRFSIRAVKNVFWTLILTLIFWYLMPPPPIRHPESVPVLII